MNPESLEIRWDHIRILHEKDREAGQTLLLLCPRLTRHHIYLNNAAKMRVSLAVQVILADSSVIISFHTR